MGIILLTDIKQNAELDRIINTCKSNSGICGSTLRKAHYDAGILLGRVIGNEYKKSKTYALIIMMRAGLSFGLGIADSLEYLNNHVQIFFNNKTCGLTEEFSSSQYHKVIFIDAVIKTGQSMIDLSKKICETKKIIYATNVFDETAINNVAGKDIFAIRTSKNSFIGSNQKEVKEGKGPDTGDRLFNSLFFEDNSTCI